MGEIFVNDRLISLCKCSFRFFESGKGVKMNLYCGRFINIFLRNLPMAKWLFTYIIYVEIYGQNLSINSGSATQRENSFMEQIPEVVDEINWNGKFAAKISLLMKEVTDHEQSQKFKINTENEFVSQSVDSAVHSLLRDMPSVVDVIKLFLRKSRFPRN